MDPRDGSLARFALALRQLRAAAGYPSYRDLAGKALFSPSVLSAAARGSSLPSLQVTLAYVSACGGDTREWHRRWENAATDMGLRKEDSQDADGRIGPAATAPAVTPAELPPEPACYTGRDLEIRRFLALADPLGRSRAGAVVISGPVGVGKTAFALHVAQRVSPLYRDGQLYANLASGRSAHDVTGSFLKSLGLPAPADPRQRTGLYRSVLAARRILVLLDNASHEATLRPLLVTGTRSLLLATSRSRLAGLDTVRRITLGMLSPADSRALVATLAGPQLLTAGPDAAGMLGELCGHLPLALWIAATRLAATPEYVLARLNGAVAPLDWLRIGDASVRQRLRSAYRQLGPLARRAFRGLAPAVDGGVSGLSEHLLEQLADHGLLQLSSTGYRMPVLFHAFARELSDAGNQGPERELLDVAWRYRRACSYRLRRRTAAERHAAVAPYPLRVVI